eukprot:TRINITY_DN3655_c0_g1_i1.p2 TRINITY_DN3655_c0_g1~~TRINITY_DN3655_c0_g1_i1.p2  ORF type:complete len:160 (+),score=8.46 TRINITY_DN3655_c0_g1_i1:276-755(+)
MLLGLYSKRSSTPSMALTVVLTKKKPPTKPAMRKRAVIGFFSNLPNGLSMTYPVPNITEKKYCAQRTMFSQMGVSEARSKAGCDTACVTCSMLSAACTDSGSAPCRLPSTAPISVADATSPVLIWTLSVQRKLVRLDAQGRAVARCCVRTRRETRKDIC